MARRKGGGNRPPQVEKPLGFLILELLQSLQVMRDSIGIVRHGGLHQVIPLSGQLRAVLLESRRDAHALLLEVAARLNASPTIFVMHGTDDPLPPSVPEPEFIFSGFPMSVEREISTQTEIPLGGLPAHKVLFYEGKHYSFKEVVEFYANRSGGAHYSKSLPETFARLTQTNIGGFALGDALLRVMLQASEAVYAVGLDLIRKFTDFDLFVDLGIPKPKAGGNILDAAYPDSPMRLTVSLGDEHELRARLHGLSGHDITVELAGIDWSIPHVLRISGRHADSLATRLSVSVDGGTLHSDAYSPSPVFLASDIRSAESIWNGSLDGTGAGMLLAVSEVLMVGRISQDELDQLTEYFALENREPNRKVCLYPDSSVGRSPSGLGDVQMEGDVVVGHMDRVMADMHSSKTSKRSGSDPNRDCPAPRR
jgi:hypothetical protein